MRLADTARAIKFCNACGAATAYRIPEGDSLLRAVCAACGTIHYQNPKMVVGCLATFEDRRSGLFVPRFGDIRPPAR